MPGWLIALLIILVVLVLGCGGCFVGCYVLAQKGLEAGSRTIEEGTKKLEEIGKQIEQEIEKERKAQEARLRELGTMPAIENPLPGAARLPANYPADIPSYRGATLTSANSHADGGTVLYSASDPIDRIVRFYETQMTQRGWQTGERIGNMREYTKAGRKVNIKVYDNAGATTVEIDYGTE